MNSSPTAPIAFGMTEYRLTCTTSLTPKSRIISGIQKFKVSVAAVIAK